MTVTTPTASQTSQKPVLVVDYGAQYAQLIARRVREANVYSEVVPHTYTTEQLLAKNPAAIILGDGRSVLEGMPQHQKTWMSHGDSVHEAPAGFDVLATTAGAEVAAFANEEKGLFGVQWHPEVKHSAYGQQVLENFLFKGARIEPNWTTGNILEEQVERIRKQIGDARVICGLSGGVDSAVAAALVQRAVGD